ncbi:MAG: SpoIID/LytB domain-containing protein [Bacteroidales bacterium]
MLPIPFLLVWVYIISSISISFAQNISISLFHGNKIDSLMFIVVTGSYQVMADSVIKQELREKDTIVFHRIENRIRVVQRNNVYAESYSDIVLRGIGQHNMYFIEPLEQGLIKRIYDDDLLLYASEDKIKIIADVTFDKYIAGVVESEVGKNAEFEFYKAQAIICRTYAIKYIRKHLLEGANLCDQVHCQVYKFACTQNARIRTAVEETSGLIIVDEAGEPISATFFSNSGGQTANSEDVWQKSVPYLRSIKDPYSIDQPHYRWEYEMPKKEWVEYLNKKGANVSMNTKFKYTPKVRELKLPAHYGSVSIKDIRKDFTFNSTFFSFKQKGSIIHFEGKGFGHAVGLSQEGGMNMARLGYSYSQIIHFYYTDVKIIHLDMNKYFSVKE